VTLVEFKGVWTRPDFPDRQIVNEVYRFYSRFEPRPDDVVVDLGAHIGAFTKVYCGNVARAVAFEPNPEVLPALQQNCSEVGAEARSMAVTVDGRDCQFSWPPRNHKGDSMCSTVPRGRVPEGIPLKLVNVRSTAFSDLVAELSPTVLKLDMEGAEHEFLQQIPEVASLRHVLCEILVTRGAWRKAAGVFVEAMATAGYQATWSHGITDKSWNYVYSFERRP